MEHAHVPRRLLAGTAHSPTAGLPAAAPAGPARARPGWAPAPPPPPAAVLIASTACIDWLPTFPPSAIFCGYDSAPPGERAAAALSVTGLTERQREILALIDRAGRAMALREVLAALGPQTNRRQLREDLATPRAQGSVAHLWGAVGGALEKLLRLWSGPLSACHCFARIRAGARRCLTSEDRALLRRSRTKPPPNSYQNSMSE